MTASTSMNTFQIRLETNLSSNNASARPKFDDESVAIMRSVLPSTQLPIYLNAARLGLTSPSTRLALDDLNDFMSERGSTSSFDQFLRGGWERWPEDLRTKYTGLKAWKGLREFYQSLKRVGGVGTECQILTAERTATLIKLGIRFLLRRCDRILITDLAWPAHSQLLHDAVWKSRQEIFVIPVRDFILQEKSTVAEVVQLIAGEYSRLCCDGLFLPEISHDGIRLPLAELSKRLSEETEPRFFMIDGAQAFAQVSMEQSLPTCDFCVAGSHKWLGAHHPLAIGFCPKPKTQRSISRVGAKLDDPLLAFLYRLETRSDDKFSETVDLDPLFSCRTAISDLFSAGRTLSGDFAVRQKNAAQLMSLFGRDWKPIVPKDEFQSGSFLVRAAHQELRNLAAHELCARFESHGIALTAYDGGLLRLSMPHFPWSHRDLETLARAFDGVIQ